MFPFRRLTIWQRSHQATIRTYRNTRAFPSEERYGLATQLRRAAVSVAANIAEGSKRASSRDFAHFINIAESSAAEAGYLFELAGALEVLDSDTAASAVAEYDEISRMLFRFRQRLNRQTRSP